MNDRAMPQAQRVHPELGELFRVFLRIGLLSFGGPAAQIALMHRTLVDEKRWLEEQPFLNALSFCMLLPGPEAMQLATYAGWRLRGLIGGLIAGLLFVLPGAFVILAFAMVYMLFAEMPVINALFFGLKAAVLVIVLEALLKVSKRALKRPLHWYIAALAFVGIFFFALPFPLIIVVSALYGYLFCAQSGEPNAPKVRVETSLRRTMLTVLTGLALWLIPVAIIDTWSGVPVLGLIASFFSKLAVVTFGGAYAVLAYMAQDVVTQFGWLSAGEMLDGLGLAETTPGPLILVTEFVGFIAAYREGGIGLGLAGAAITLWVTFVPCFLWIFAGAPYLEWIAAQPRLSGALSTITAAVVGVILNLSIWFSLHVLFTKVNHEQFGILSLWQPELASFDWRAGALAALCTVLLLRLHVGLGWVLLGSSLLGWVLVNFV